MVVSMMESDVKRFEAQGILIVDNTEEISTSPLRRGDQSSPEASRGDLLVPCLGVVTMHPPHSPGMWALCPFILLPDVVVSSLPTKIAMHYSLGIQISYC